MTFDRTDLLLAAAALLAVAITIYAHLENTLLSRLVFVWRDHGRDWKRARESFPRRLWMTWRMATDGTTGEPPSDARRGVQR